MPSRKKKLYNATTRLFDENNKKLQFLN